MFNPMPRPLRSFAMFFADDPSDVPFAAENGVSLLAFIDLRGASLAETRMRCGRRRKSCRANRRALADSS